MDISKISGNINSNTVNSTRNKVSDDSFEKHLKSAFDTKDDEDLKKACQEFEGIMLNMLYKQMKATIPKSELLESDMGKEIFESMLDEELVEEASKSGSLGLGDTLYKQLSKRLKASYEME